MESISKTRKRLRSARQDDNFNSNHSSAQLSDSEQSTPTTTTPSTNTAPLNSSHLTATNTELIVVSTTDDSRSIKLRKTRRNQNATQVQSAATATTSFSTFNVSSNHTSSSEEVKTAVDTVPTVNTAGEHNNSITAPSNPNSNNDTVPQGAAALTFPSKSGYYLSWHWETHYPFFNDQHTIQSLQLPTETETALSSIPSLYHAVIQAIAKAERVCRGVDVIPLLDAPVKSDRKIVKFAREAVSALKTASPLNDTNTDVTKVFDLKSNEYALIACRKEHLKQLFDKGDGLLARCGMCPLLLDVYAADRFGKRLCVGGVGTEARESGKCKGELHCRCEELKQRDAARTAAAQTANQDKVLNQIVKTEGADETQIDYVMEEAANELRLEQTSESPAQASNKHLSHSKPLTSPITKTQEQLNNNMIAVAEKQEDQAIDVNEDSLPASEVTVQPLTGETSSVEADKLRKKIATLQRHFNDSHAQVDLLRQQMNEWKAKFIEEQSVNKKLWSRLIAVQKQMRLMSRPVQTALAHQGRLGMRSEWH